MKRELRSNKAMNFMRRSHWLTLGLSDEDMEKPKIAVVNSSSEIAVCFSHLDEIAKKTKDAIRAAGGVAFEVMLGDHARRHPMWWSHREQTLYDLHLRLPKAPPFPVAFRVRTLDTGGR